MVYSYNSEIETLLKDLKVPVSYMFYEGSENTYITYQQESQENSFAGDDQVRGFVIYYDVDIYSKGNYESLVADVIKAFIDGGWVYQPSRVSPDLYERDTKFFHKTLSFAKESEG